MVIQNENTEAISIIETLQAYLNMHVLIDHHAYLDRFPDKLPALRIKQMKEIIKQNVDILGGYTGIYTFGLEIRILNTQDPAFVYHLFDDINDFLKTAKQDKNYPDFQDNIVCQDIEMCSYPVLNQRTDDGKEDYLAVYSMSFIKRTTY